MKQLAIIPSLNILSVMLHQHHDSDYEAGSLQEQPSKAWRDPPGCSLWGQTITAQMERLKIGQSSADVVAESLFYPNLLKEDKKLKRKGEKRKEKYQSSLSKKAL